MQAGELAHTSYLRMMELNPSISAVLKQKPSPVCVHSCWLFLSLSSYILLSVNCFHPPGTHILARGLVVHQPIYCSCTVSWQQFILI